MPLTVMWGEQNLRFGAPKLSYTLAKVRTGPNLGALIDGAFDERFHRDLVETIRKGGEIDIDAGKLRLAATEHLQQLDLSADIRSTGVEQSNVSFIIGDQAILKIYRRLRRGEQPEIEVGAFPHRGGRLPNTPAFLGAVEFVRPTGM